jgi:hypothetical protein
MRLRLLLQADRLRPAGQEPQAYLRKGIRLWHEQILLNFFYLYTTKLKALIKSLFLFLR